MVNSIPPVLRAVWWISVVWLALAAVCIIYNFGWWLINAHDSRRYETVIVSMLILFYSVPAGVGVLVAGAVPKTGLSPLRRVAGIALALFCLGVFLVHNYLQSKPR